MSFEEFRRAARVHWTIGQPLLPAHFYAQEESLREEAALRARSFGAPAWGFQRLEWDGDELRRGLLQLRRLTVFFESGEVIDDKANAELPPPLELTGASTRVFLHLDGVKVIRSAPGDPHEEDVERTVRQLRLDTDPSREEGFPMIELGVFEQRGASNEWQLAPASLPPLVGVQNDAFRTHAFPALERFVHDLYHVVARHQQQRIASAARNAATVLVRRGVHEFESLWYHLRDGLLAPHPYRVFSAMLATYFDLCVLHDHTPEQLLYDHSDLGRSFAALFGAAAAVLPLDQQPLPHVPFTPLDGLQVCSLRPEMKKGTRAFWLIRKDVVAEEINLRGVKLAAKSRIAEVESHALRGIPFERVTNPPFSKEFSPNVEFYALNGGAEWDKAVAEKSVAFYNVGQLKQLQSYLYYAEG